MKSMIIAALISFTMLGKVFAQTKKDSLTDVKLDEVLVISKHSIFGSKRKQVNVGGSGYFMSPRELQMFSYTDIGEQLQLIPGVNIQQEDGFGLRPRISFRGVAPGRSDKITLMEDGILIAPAPYSAPAAYYFPTAGRMHALEVLKGSSQIKYGPQTTAGVLNMISTPIPNQLSANVNLSWGAFNTRVVHANAGNTHKNFAYLIEAFKYASDGFKQLDGGNGKDTGFDKTDYMAKFMWKTAEGNSLPQSLLLKLQYSDELSDETYLGLSDADFKSNPYRRYAASQVDEMKTDHQVYSLTHSIQPAENINITTTAYQTKFHRNWYKLGGYQNADGTKGKKISHILEDPIANKDAFAVLQGGNTTSDYLKVKANNRKYDVKGVQTELNWAIDGEAVKQNISIGARYHYDQIDRFQWEDKYGMKDGVMLMQSRGKKGDAGNRIQDSKALAAYLQYEMEWNGLTVTPGIRYENIEQTRKNFDKGDPRRTKPKYRENTTKVILPGVSAQYQLTSGTKIFAGLHKGFSPAGNVPDTEDENSLNYEFGLRYGNSRLKTELVGFYSDYSNLLGADLIASGGTGSGDKFNAGEADVKGIEFLTTYNLISTREIDLPIMLTYTYTDTKLKNNYASSVWGTVKPGDEIPYIAKHQVGFVASLQHRKYELNLTGKYQDKLRTKAGQDDIPKGQGVDAFFTVDASAKYIISENFSANLSILNIMNSEYEVARSPYGLRPGRPLSFNLGLSFTL